MCDITFGWQIAAFSKYISTFLGDILLLTWLKKLQNIFFCVLYYTWMTNSNVFYIYFKFFGDIIADLVEKASKYIRGRNIEMSFGLDQIFWLIFCVLYYTWMTNSSVLYIYFNCFWEIHYCWLGWKSSEIYSRTLHRDVLRTLSDFQINFVWVI